MRKWFLVLPALILAAGCSRDAAEKNNPPVSATATADTAPATDTTVTTTGTSATVATTPTETSSTVVSTTRKE